MNHGRTSRIVQAIPSRGFSRISQCAERSTVTSVAAASPATIRMTGPLIRMPTATAVQKIAAIAISGVCETRSPWSRR